MRIDREINNSVSGLRGEVDDEIEMGIQSRKVIENCHPNNFTGFLVYLG